MGSRSKLAAFVNALPPGKSRVTPLGTNPITLVFYSRYTLA